MSRRDGEALQDTRPFAYGVTVVASALAAGGLAALEIRSLEYGWVLFLVVPYFIGFFASAVLRFWGPKPARTSYWLAGSSAAVLALGFLIFGIEGLVCIAMAAPIAVPLVFLGAFCGYVLLHERALLSAAGGTALVLLLAAATSGLERTFPLAVPTFTVTDSITVAAPPDVVWQSLISMGSLGQPNDWIFRAGVACPQRVDIYGRGEGAMRVCTLSTGLLNEKITTWEPGQRMRWVSLTTPAPLKELNPFREAAPPHLHGFYRSVGGEFELTPAGNGATRVIRRSSYQHHMYPAWYWRIWCDYVASRGHIYVLGVLKESAERHRGPANLQARR